MPLSSFTLLFGYWVRVDIRGRLGLGQVYMNKKHALVGGCGEAGGIESYVVVGRAFKDDQLHPFTVSRFTFFHFFARVFTWVGLGRLTKNSLQGVIQTVRS